MSSQEEYLDELLNGLADDLSQEETDIPEEVNLQEELGIPEEIDVPEELGIPEESVISTEDDILEGLNLPQEDDLMELLKGSGDEELLEIQDLLEKSDNNELIEAEIETETEHNQENVAEENPKYISAEERKKQKEADREARKARKEAKKAERAAKKEARKAERAARKEERNSQKAETEEIAEDADVSMEDSIEEESIEDILAEIPIIEDIPTEPISAEPISEVSSSSKTFDGTTEEDDIFAGMASLDELFGDSSGVLDATGESDFMDITGEIPDDFAADTKEEVEEKGLWSRFIQFLTEDDEGENENLPLSEENREILNEMDKEGKKKTKAKKAKKEKKGKESAKQSKRDKKPKKEKKPKKPKKEKKPKVEEVIYTGKKLSPKRVMIILLLALSIGVFIIVCSTVGSDYTLKQAGQKAFYEGDYQTCYQNLYGKHLNQKEQIMYNKSESILRIRLWLREYELLSGDGEELEALDSLIQSVYAYPELYAYASEWSAAGEVAEYYNRILTILGEKYQLTEAQAIEIANTEHDAVYTRIVMDIVAGKGYHSGNGESAVPDELPDELPEESELKNPKAEGQ